MDDLGFSTILSGDANPFDRRQARRAFSRVGLAFVVLLIVWNAVDLALVYLVSVRWPEIANATWFLLLVNAVSLYGIGFPVYNLILKRLPVLKQERTNLSAGRFMICLMMCYALLIAGNLVGLLVTSLIQVTTGMETTNTAYDLLTSGENMAVLLISVGILAPVFEELMCRRLILDRLRVYGEKTALIVSALAFAALHGNLSQFFYAFVLGLFFGYLYLRTGKLRYTIFLHMIINVFSTILSALSMDLLSLADFEAAGFSSLDPLLLLRIFAAVILMSIEYSFALAGLVLLILRRKSFVFPGGEPRLIPEGERLRTVLVNPGILASIFCTGLVFLLGYLI